jgi:hypothetical protein
VLAQFPSDALLSTSDLSFGQKRSTSDEPVFGFITRISRKTMIMVRNNKNSKQFADSRHAETYMGSLVVAENP